MSIPIPAAACLTCLVLMVFFGPAGKKKTDDALPGLTAFCAGVAVLAAIVFMICAIWLIWSLK